MDVTKIFSRKCSLILYRFCSCFWFLNVPFRSNNQVGNSQNSLSLFDIYVLKHNFYSESCTNVVVVINANSDDKSQKNFISSSEECKRHCLFEYSQKEQCKMASWNKINNLCSIYSEISNNVSPLEDSEIYFISKVNSC